MKKKLFILMFIFLCPVMFFSCKKETPLGIENLSEYNISVTLDDENYTLSCNQEVSVYNSSGTDLDKLKFHLYPKAFSLGVKNPAVSTLYTQRAYPNGVSYGDIEITKCTIEDKNVEFFTEGIDNDILVTPLSDNFKDKTYLKIDMEYNVKLPNINHRFGYGENAINLGNFYPILCVYENDDFSVNPYSTNGDPFYSDVSNYKVNITYPSNYVLAHIAMSLSKNFNMLTDNVDDIEIKYYYYKDTQPETSLKACKDSLITFNDFFGKYPYKQLSVVETNFVYGGMEFPNIVFISDDIDSYSDYLNTIVHEIAHQWWYGIVGNDEYSYGWLDEGLTEYSTALFYEKNPDYQVTLKDVITNTTNSYLLFIEVYTDVFGNCDTTMNRKLNEYNTEPEYVYISYVKAALLFNQIRELVGKEDFVKGLKNYVETYKGKNVKPDDFIECMEKTTKKPIKDIVYSYINGNVIIMANE